MHPEFAAFDSFAHLKLGRLPSKNKPTQLRLAKYLTPRDLPEPPASFDLTGDVAAWPMYDNDRLGDCTCAAAGHMVEAWSAAIGAEIEPLDVAVDSFYWETGDPPAATGQAGGPTDTGRVETDVLDYWRKTPLGEHPIDAYAAVDVKDGSQVLAGTWIFGGLYIGVALPITAQRQTVWDVVDSSLQGDSTPGSWGGHAIDVVSYGSSSQGFTVQVVTWGGLMQMTQAFWDAYVDEAYAVLSPDWLGAKGTPAGFDLATLQSDLAAISQP